MAFAFDDPRLPARFWEKVAPSDRGCWEFTGSKSKGYGKFYLDGKNHRAHKLVWQTLVGSVADGLVLDHECRNRACCNPSHLEVVTNRENILRGSGVAATNARKTHCIHGHELTPDNLLPYRLPVRECRICKEAERVRTRLRKKELAQAS